MAVMSFSVTLQSPPFFRTPLSHSHPPRSSLLFPAYRTTDSPLHASSQRVSNFSQGGSNFVDDPRIWSRPISSARGGGDYDDDDEDDDGDDNDDDRSLDLLVRFVHNVFKKLSKKARKAVQSVLPVSISARLVGFSVNGVLVLAFLWILKAFLEVVCTLGSVVFVSILLIRGIWSGVCYLQESRNQKVNEFDVEHHAWNGTHTLRVSHEVKVVVSRVRGAMMSTELVAGESSGIIYGNWLVGFTKYLGPATAFVAEMWGLLQGLKLAWNRGFRFMQLELDSEALIEIIKGEKEGSYADKNMIKQIRSVLKKDWQLEIIHTY